MPLLQVPRSSLPWNILESIIEYTSYQRTSYPALNDCLSLFWERICSSLLGSLQFSSALPALLCYAMLHFCTAVRVFWPNDIDRDHEQLSGGSATPPSRHRERGDSGGAKHC